MAIPRSGRPRQATIGRGSGRAIKKGGSGRSGAISGLSPSQRARLFVIACVGEGIPCPATEVKFHPTRKFRFDFCWKERKLALEVDGGIWTHGRHTRGAGWLKDTEKLNLAASMGYRLLRCTPEQLFSAEMFETIKQALAYEDAA